MQLKDLYPQLDGQERERLAAKAEISAGYLYQLATKWQGKTPSLPVIKRLAAADKRLSVRDLVREFVEPAKA